MRFRYPLCVCVLHQAMHTLTDDDGASLAAVHADMKPANILVFDDAHSPPLRLVFKV